MCADDVDLLDENANVLEGELERRKGVLEKTRLTNKCDKNGIV